MHPRSLIAAFSAHTHYVGTLRNIQAEMFHRRVLACAVRKYVKYIFEWWGSNDIQYSSQGCDGGMQYGWSSLYWIVFHVQKQKLTLKRGDNMKKKGKKNSYFD